MKKIRFKQSGVTMIEVLVTLLVLAIGMAGVMSMEALALRTGQQAYLRTQAILQAQEMADRMHANRAGVEDGDYRGTIPSSKPSPDCLAANCTTTQLASYDLWEWNDNTGKLLPTGVGEIGWDASAGEHSIIVKWKERGEDGMEDKQFSYVYKPVTIYALD